MPREIRPADGVTLSAINSAIVFLRYARDCLDVADAPRALIKTRAALSSAEGAQRHALHRISRRGAMPPVTASQADTLSRVARQANAIGEIVRLRRALQEIADQALTEEPEAEVYDDTESAYNNGLEVAHWESAEIARKALAGVSHGT